jgi:hypothetical protein
MQRDLTQKPDSVIVPPEPVTIPDSPVARGGGVTALRLRATLQSPMPIFRSVRLLLPHF